MKWRYSLRWKLPSPCPGPHELASEVVEAGQPAPESVMSRWVPGMRCVWIFPMSGRSGAGVRSVKPPRVAAILSVVSTKLPPCLLRN